MLPALILVIAPLLPIQDVPAGGASSAAETAEPAALGVADLAATARLLGLEFTEAELEDALDEVRERLGAYDRLRRPELENSVIPALLFDPLLPGIEARIRVPADGAAPDRAAPEARRPEEPEQLLFLTIPELGALLRTGQTSCVELTELSLARLQRVDPHLACVVTLLPERARRQARDLDRELMAGHDRGPLHGIPYGAKDLLSVAGAPTTWGARPYEEQVLEHTATAVRRLDGAGAVLVAKLTLGALAMGDVWFGGTTKNPWDTSRGSSGSSAGSAAATAAGAVVFALGSETLGSIVSPSVRCGNSSIRPTFGRVSRDGAMTLSWSMDKLGALARTLDDAWLVLDAIAGPDGRDPTVHDLPLVDPRALSAKGLVIGVPASAFEGRRGEAYVGVLDELRGLGHTLVDVELPDYPVGDLLITISVESACAFDALTRSDRDDLLVSQRGWPRTFRAARFVPAVEYLTAQRLRTQLCQELHAALAGVDVLVHPPYASGVLRITNLTGHPTVTAPIFLEGRDTPTGLCFTGQLFDEGTLVALASQWQEASGHHLRRPPMDYLDGPPPGADDVEESARAGGEGGR